jgi:hypothetical protein
VKGNTVHLSYNRPRHQYLSCLFRQQNTAKFFLTEQYWVKGGSMGHLRKRKLLHAKPDARGDGPVAPPDFDGLALG